MMTRELGDADRDAALELLRTAKSGCPFKGLSAEAYWRRWRFTSTILGTFDDAGELYSVRVLDRLDATRARLRAGCHRDPLDAAVGYSETMKRSLRGYVAWLRHVGIERVIVAILPGMLEAWAPVRPHLDGTITDGSFECSTDDLAAFAEAT
jgi:hypothetical protein